MRIEAVYGVLIPLLGTTLGAACVFFMRKNMKDGIQRSLTGFASGVMVAASVWSLLIPSIQHSENMRRFAFQAPRGGLWAGMLFLLLLDNITPHLHINSEVSEGPRTNLKKTTMLVLAVTIHNIPEGMAVGVVYAGFLLGNSGITAMAALVLSVGIAIQNFPEGAIISMPLRANGLGRGKSFLYGFLSGVVEPVAAFVTILAAGIITPAMPYLLSFAAGAMIYVVVEELIPEMSQGRHSNIGVIAFAIGFGIMMMLDVALG